MWFTFASDRVHWVRFAGRNITDRQHITRKAANQGRRSAALPPGQRLAVLSAMMAVTPRRRNELDGGSHRLCRDLHGPGISPIRDIHGHRGLAPALVETIAALDPDKTAALRDRFAALGRGATLDNTTSSKPSSSDGLNKKTTTPKHIRLQHGSPAKPSGDQPGQRGPTLTPTAIPNHVMDHDPSACAAVTDEVFPTGVTVPVQYGPRITAWVSDLLHVQVSPETRLADLMSDRFAVSISTATIAAMSRCTAQRFEDIVDRIRTVIPVKHLDETGVRIEGRTVGSTCCAPRS